MKCANVHFFSRLFSLVGPDFLLFQCYAIIVGVAISLQQWPSSTSSKCPALSCSRWLFRSVFFTISCVSKRYIVPARQVFGLASDIFFASSLLPSIFFQLKPSISLHKSSENITFLESSVSTLFYRTISKKRFPLVANNTSFLLAFRTHRIPGNHHMMVIQSHVSITVKLSTFFALSTVWPLPFYFIIFYSYNRRHYEHRRVL